MINSSKFIKTKKIVGFNIEMDLKIPVAKNINLNATLYSPLLEIHNPTILCLTPYISDTYHERAKYFAQNKFNFLLIDCRGRGNSDGEFIPNTYEKEDFPKIFQWIKSQKWFDGNLTMWGGSYSGFSQWMAVAKQCKELKTIVPTASAYMAYDFPMYKNLVFPYISQWLSLVNGKTSNKNLFSDSEFWDRNFKNLHQKNIAFQSLESIVSKENLQFSSWMQHPKIDSFWEKKRLSETEYKNVKIPILTITGYYDGDQLGALRYYKEHLEFGEKQFTKEHYLIIGPWDHAGTRSPKRNIAGIEFSENSIIDMNKLHLQWYNWIIRKQQKPEILKDKVVYYLMGKEEWKSAPNLSSISKKSLSFYLNSNSGKANDIFNSGFLQTKSSDSQPDKYIYNPCDTRFSNLEFDSRDKYLTDQKEAYNLFGAGLIYHSPPFEKMIEFTGEISFTGYFSMNVLDTDIYVSLSEILPDGNQIFLTSDYIRARYRDSLLKENFIIPHKIEEFNFNKFTFFSRLISKGSRLRLLIKAPNSIYVQKNFNSGENVVTENAKNSKIAEVILYHNHKYPSVLKLPIVEEYN